MADTYDVLTTTESRLAVGLTATDTSQDTRLPVYVTAISRRLDQLCGPIVQRLCTSESNDGGHNFVDLRYWPVVSVTGVQEYDMGASKSLVQEAPGSISPDAYLLEPWRAAWYKGRVFRRSGGRDWLFPRGRNNVLVTYLAGRYTATATVDALFKEAASLTLSNVFRKEQRPASPAFQGPDVMGDHSAPGMPGYLLPYVVEQLLVDEILPGSA